MHLFYLRVRPVQQNTRWRHLVGFYVVTLYDTGVIVLHDNKHNTNTNVTYRRLSHISLHNVDVLRGGGRWIAACRHCLQKGPSYVFTVFSSLSNKMLLGQCRFTHKTVWEVHQNVMRTSVLFPNRTNLKFTTCNYVSGLPTWPAHELLSVDGFTIISIPSLTCHVVCQRDEQN